MISSWVFHELEEDNIDPFELGYLSIMSTEMRTDIPNVTFDPKDLILNNTNGIYTIYSKDAFVEFIFAKQTISMYKYRLKSLAGHCSPSGWIIEGSNNGRKYQTISRKKESLCRANHCSVNVDREFEVDNHKFYRRIRVMQPDGECNSTCYWFGLAALDFYGALSIREIKLSHYCKCRTTQAKLFLLFITYK